MLKLKINLKNIYYLDVFKKKSKTQLGFTLICHYGVVLSSYFVEDVGPIRVKKAPFFLHAQCSSAGLVKPRKENLEAFLSEIGHSV
jgi:hypothetical protein